MFFYISLLVGSVVGAVLLLYFVQAIMSLGRSAYSSLLPSAQHRRTSHLENTKFTENNKTQTPWGWAGHSSPATVAKTHPAVPADKASWGWKGQSNDKRQAAEPKGLDGFIASKTTPKPTVGWPYREEKSDVVGSAYKVTRKVKPAKSNLKDNGKPWGW